MMTQRLPMDSNGWTLLFLLDSSPWAMRSYPGLFQSPSEIKSKPSKWVEIHKWKPSVHRSLPKFGFGSDSLEKKPGKNTKLVQKSFTMDRIHKKNLQNIRLENHLEMGHHWTSTGTKHLQKTHGPMAFIPSKELPLSPAHQQRSPGNSTGGCKRARHGQVTEPKLSKNHHLVLQNSPKLDLLSLLMSTSCDWTSQISTRNQPGVPPRPALP